MSSKERVEANERNDESTRRRGRSYTVAGGVLVGALVVALIVGMAGVIGPGILSPSEAFFVIGAAGAVLAIGVVGLLFSMKKTLELVKEQQSAIDVLQDERTQAMAEEQHRIDSEQDQQVDELRSTMAESDTSNNRHGSSQITPFGDVHGVIDVEGIGEDFASQLRDLGIVDTEQLWKADPEPIASALDVRKKTVRGWQSMAELMALKHVGPQYAELLVRADIDSISQLGESDPARVAGAVQKAEGDREVRIQGNLISEKHTRKWVEAARDHDPQDVRVER